MKFDSSIEPDINLSHRKRVVGLSWGYNDWDLATASINEVCVWNLKTKRNPLKIKAIGVIRELAWNPRKSVLAVIELDIVDYRVSLTDALTGSKKKEYINIYPIYPEYPPDMVEGGPEWSDIKWPFPLYVPPSSPKLAWSPDGEKLAISENMRVSIINLQNDTIDIKNIETDKKPNDALALAWSPTDNLIAVHEASNFNKHNFGVVVDLRSTKSWRKKASIRYYQKTSWITSISWRNDGKFLAFAIGNGGPVAICDIGTTTITKTLKPKQLTRQEKAELKYCLGGSHIEGAIGPHGRRVRSGMKFDEGYYYRKNVANITVTSVSWHPSGKFIAGGSDKGSITLWKWPAGQLVKTIGIPTIEGPPIVTVQWSPNGRKLAACCGKDVLVWDSSKLGIGLPSETFSGGAKKTQKSYPDTTNISSESSKSKPVEQKETIEINEKEIDKIVEGILASQDTEKMRKLFQEKSKFLTHPFIISAITKGLSKSSSRREMVSEIVKHPALIAKEKIRKAIVQLIAHSFEPWYIIQEVSSCSALIYEYSDEVHEIVVKRPPEQSNPVSVSMKDVIHQRVSDISHAIKTMTTRLDILEAVKDCPFVIGEDEIELGIKDLLESQKVSLKFIETLLEIPEIMVKKDLADLILEYLEPLD